MTKYQQHCLRFIAKYLEEHGGISPSLDEIAAGIGITSKGSVHRYLDLLEADGLIRRAKRRSRSIEIIEPGEVKLNQSVFALLKQYAEAEGTSVDGAACQILRDALEREAA
jgi:repressor LexA